MTPCLVYGASGYTGRRVIQAAVERGLAPILGGRDGDKLAAVARERELPYRTADLGDRDAVARLLEGVRVVLNTAGPFSHTTPALLDACLEHDVHYLDLSAEVLMIELAASRSAEAKRRGVMLLPGAGFDVVPSDCLAAHVTRRVSTPRRLFIGLSGLAWASRGSAKTMVEQLDKPTWSRRQGVLCDVPEDARLRNFDYGAGLRQSVAVAWGDVASAYFSTGVDDITTYFEATSAVRAHAAMMRWFGWAIPWTPWQAWLDTACNWLPEVPTDSEFSRRRAVIVAEVEDAHGRVRRARLRTPEVYTFTATIAAALLERACAGDVEPGFQTACRLYGPDYVMGFDGVDRQEF